MKRGLECGSDHHAVIAKVAFPLKAKFKQVKKENGNGRNVIEEPTYMVNLLQDESIRFLYQSRLSLKLKVINEDWEAKELYEFLKKSIMEVAEESLGRERQSGGRTEWITKEILETIDHKKTLYNKWLSTKSNEDLEQYRECKRNVKRLVKSSKNESWERICGEIDHELGYNRSAQAWRLLRKMRKSNNPSPVLQLITMNQWENYFQDLLVERRNEKESDQDITIRNGVEPISEEEVREALKKSKSGKASGPGGVTAELWKYGPPLLVRLITKMFNQILEGDEIPEDWKISYISAIHKKGDKKDPNNYRGISVMPSISRIFNSIIKNRLEEEIEGKISEDQAGFTTGRSCMDNIFNLRQISEKMYAKGKETHLVFIDLEKAYDSVPIKQLWEEIKGIGVSLPLIALIQRLYKDCQAAVKIGKRLSAAFYTTKGLRQGCSISPTLFKIYIQQILKQWNNSCRGMGIPVGNETVHSLLFADDQVIIAQCREDAKFMVRKLLEAFEAGGLKVNMSKTEYLVIGGDGRNIKLPQGIIKIVKEFKYLGSVLHETGNCKADIDYRIMQGRGAIKMLNGVLWSRTITMQTKKRILEVIVESILTYGAEGWSLSEGQKSKIQAVEMDGIRRGARISRLEKRRNEDVRRIMNMEESVIARIENRQLQWYGHVRRMDEGRWPNVLLQWSPAGRKKRGRPRNSWRAGILRMMNDKGLNEQDWNDRRRWKMGIKGNH